MPQWLCSAAATTAAVFIPMSRCSLHPTQESLGGYSVKFFQKWLQESSLLYRGLTSI